MRLTCAKQFNPRGPPKVDIPKVCPGTPYAGGCCTAGYAGSPGCWVTGRTQPPELAIFSFNSNVGKIWTVLLWRWLCFKLLLGVLSEATGYAGSLPGFKHIVTNIYIDVRVFQHFQLKNLFSWYIIMKNLEPVQCISWILSAMMRLGCVISQLFLPLFRNLQNQSPRKNRIDVQNLVVRQCKLCRFEWSKMENFVKIVFYWSRKIMQLSS